MRKSKFTNILTKQLLEEEYKKYKSLQKIADKFKISVDTITKYFKFYNIEYNGFACKYSFDENFFKKISEESLYVAGFIAADGCVQYRKYSQVLKICLSEKDKSHLIKIHTLFKSNHPIFTFKVKPNKLVKTEQTSVEFSIVSKKICEDLKKFNIIPNKTFIYKMPEWLINHPLNHHFIRGYIDGDGCFSLLKCKLPRKINQINFGLIGTQNFLEQIINILTRKCNLSKTKINKKTNIFTINYAGNGNAKKLFNFLYSNASIFLERKYYIINKVNDYNTLINEDITYPGDTL